MTELTNANILLIGAGKMGSALHAAWLRAGIFEEMLAVVDAKGFSAGPHVLSSLGEVKFAPDCIVLAVKPQSMDALLPELAAAFPLPNPPPEGGGKGKNGVSSLSLQGEGRGEGTPLILSIAAGKTLSYFAKHLGDASVVRAMPNTPALIGKGISVLVANKQVTPAQKELATSLLAAAGEVVWLDDESMMDAVTAVSGSGPAYAFLFMEELIEAGISQGLPRELCTKLALHTVLGSAALALASSEPLEELRKHVTSPGGTTEAALKVLIKDDRFALLMQQAVADAVKRAKELG